MKIANSIAKTAELKTMAVTKVEVDAVCAVVALTPDLTVELVFKKKNKGRKKTRTWRMAGKKEGVIECGGVGIYRRQSILIMPDGAGSRTLARG